jgi:hypothetical protein
VPIPRPRGSEGRGFGIHSSGGLWKNGYGGSFYSRQPDKFMSMTTFVTILHAHAEPTDWPRGYNNIQRHSSPSYKIPTEYADSCTKPD